MSLSPLHQAFAFWKPVADPCELHAVATYRSQGESRVRGINVWRADSDAARYRVVHGDREFVLFAAVHPIDAPPESAEVLAEITDLSGNPYSYVLWFPSEQSAVIPFDPNSAIESLRLEQYVPWAERTVLPSPLLSAYYAVKPALPVSVRSGLRRLIARKSSSVEPFLSWPSDQSLDLLMQLLLRLTLMALGRESLRFVWFWPEGRPWAAILTHDVETAEGLVRVPDT